jgi:hypothetical protein
MTVAVPALTALTMPVSISTGLSADAVIRRGDG